MANFQEVAQQFVEFYYLTFDSNRADLVNVYRPQSMLTFESSQSVGPGDIVEKLMSLPFQKIKHQVATIDAQPADESGGIIVMVTGGLLTDAEERPMSYVQVFKLAKDGASYFVHNDIFKLVYPAS